MEEDLNITCVMPDAGHENPPDHVTGRSQEFSVPNALQEISQNIFFFVYYAIDSLFS